jgi:hypothetical protein
MPNLEEKNMKLCKNCMYFENYKETGKCLYPQMIREPVFGVALLPMSYFIPIEMRRDELLCGKDAVFF